MLGLDDVVDTSRKGSNIESQSRLEPGVKMHALRVENDRLIAAAEARHDDDWILKWLLAGLFVISAAALIYVACFDVPSCRGW